VSIRLRLMIGFGVTLVLLGAQSAATLRWRRRLAELGTQESSVIAPRLEAAQALETAILAQEAALRAYAASRDPADLERFRGARGRERAVLRQLALLPVGPADNAILTKMTPRIDDFDAAAGTFAEHVQDGAPRAEAEHAASRLARLRRHVQSLAEELRAAEEREAQSARAAAAQVRGELTRGIALLSLLVAAAVAGTGLLTIRAVRGPAQRLRRAARALAAGDYAPALALAPTHGAGDAPSRDELAELALAFGRMAARLRDREDRTAAEGRLAAAVATSFDVNRLARAALDEVLAYTRAEIGIVYAHDREPGLFRRAAAVGLDDAPMGLRAGDGIPGEALAQARTITVRDVPADTQFQVRLGFATALPRMVVATPIVFQGEPVGVMLIASLRNLDAGGLEFLEQAARLLGVSLTNALGHREVTGLAAALRSKNEQLQAQHRELQAHHDALQARDVRLEQQNEELETQRRELRERTEELTRASRQKDDFLAMLGHELRNPLAAIRSASYVLGRLPDDASVASRAIIARQADQLARLVDDLLDVSRTSRGLIDLALTRVDLRVVVGDALEAAQRLAGPQRQRLAARLPDAPVWVDADVVRLGQVLGNVLSNSIKFSPAGALIRIVLEQREDRAVLRVDDQGVGISEELLPHVFELFVRGDEEAARGRSGLGLGLALARRLTEMHGGTIVARSAGHDCGTEVEITLPVSATPADLATVPAEPAAAPQPQGPQPRRVLIVEDQPDVGESLGLLLAALGHEVQQARNGAAGIAMALSDPPDVVLLDIGLPGLDGYEVARRLRGQLPSEAPTRLYALTGYTQPEDRQRAIDAGFDGFLAKPVDLEALTAALAEQPAEPSAAA
jgi:two-component system, sensor histidine kinase